MAKVIRIENGNIVCDNGVTLGRIAHPSCFERNDLGFVYPKFKVGDEIPIPDEAIMTSTDGRKYVRMHKDESQLKLEIASLDASIRKAQLKQFQP